MDNETKYCSNCQKPVGLANYELHLVFCHRHIQLCEICSEPVKKADFEEHMAQSHAPKECEKCGQVIQNWKYEEHMADDCVKRLMPCSYCELPVPWDEIKTHEDYCGGRTELCKHCKQYVRFKDKQNHFSTGDGQCVQMKPENVSMTDDCVERLMPCSYCELPVPCDEKKTHEDYCGGRTELCKHCKKYVRFKDKQNHFSTGDGQCIQMKPENVSMKLIKCPLCGKEMSDAVFSTHKRFCTGNPALDAVTPELVECPLCKVQMKDYIYPTHVKYCSGNSRLKDLIKPIDTTVENNLLENISYVEHFEVPKVNEKPVDADVQALAQTFPKALNLSEAQAAENISRDENCRVASDVGNTKQSFIRRGCPRCHAIYLRPISEIDSPCARCKKLDDMVTDTQNVETSSRNGKSVKRIVCTRCDATFFRTTPGTSSLCTNCREVNNNSKEDEHAERLKELFGSINQREISDDKEPAPFVRELVNQHKEILLSCPLCERMLSSYLLHEHLLECSSTEICCPGCSKTIKLADKDEHIAECMEKSKQPTLKYYKSEENNIFKRSGPPPPFIKKQEFLVPCPYCATKFPSLLIHEHVLTCTGFKLNRPMYLKSEKGDEMDQRIAEDVDKDKLLRTKYEPEEDHNVARAAPYRKKREFLVPCPLCEGKFSSHLLHDHMEVCSETETNCPACQKSIRLIDKDEHIAECYVKSNQPKLEYKSIEADKVEENKSDRSSPNVAKTQQIGSYIKGKFNSLKSSVLPEPENSFKAVMLPCEFCNKSINIFHLIEHQSGCKPELFRGSGSNDSENVTEDVDTKERDYDRKKSPFESNISRSVANSNVKRGKSNFRNFHDGRNASTGEFVPSMQYAGYPDCYKVYDSISTSSPFLFNATPKDYHYQKSYANVTKSPGSRGKSKDSGDYEKSPKKKHSSDGSDEDHYELCPTEFSKDAKKSDSDDDKGEIVKAKSYQYTTGKTQSAGKQSAKKKKPPKKMKHRKKRH